MYAARPRIRRFISEIISIGARTVAMAIFTENTIQILNLKKEVKAVSSSPRVVD